MGKEHEVKLDLYKKPRNFAVDPNKLNQIADGLHSFIHNLINDDGTPTVIPDYCNKQYFVEVIAGMCTKLRQIGEDMHPERVERNGGFKQ